MMTVEQSTDTSEIFLTAALDLFRQGGLDAPTIGDVCKRAGFARATFYDHFRDREALMAAVLDRVLGTVATLTLDAEPAGDPAAIVGAFLAAMADSRSRVSGSTKWKLHHTLALCDESPFVRERYLDRLREFHKRLVAQLRVGQERGAVRQDLPAEGLAGLMMGMAYGAASMLGLGVQTDYGGVAGAFIAIIAPPRRNA